jgi:hypothetical protein
MKKIFTAIFLFLAIPLHAETCPTVNEINHNNLHGWRAYDAEQNKFVTDLESFKKEVADFAQAKWMNEEEQGEAQCHYYRNFSQKTYTTIYFIKHHTLPINDLTVWKFMSESVMLCDASINQCSFVPELKV